MRLAKQGRRIVFLVRLLTGIGLAAVVTTVGLVGWTLFSARTERLRATSEQIHLNQTSNDLRRHVIEGRVEIGAMLDETVVRNGRHAAVRNLTQFVSTQLDARNDPTLVAPLLRLQTLTNRLGNIEDRANAWRDRYEIVWNDISQQRTIGYVRALIAQLRGGLDVVEARHRLEDAAKYDHWRGATGAEAADEAAAILNDQARRRDAGTGDFDSQLAKFAQLVELLDGEEQFDRLSDLKDKQLGPALGKMRESMSWLSADADAGGALTAEAVEKLRVGVFGQGYSMGDDGSIRPGRGGLFNLRVDALRLRGEREKLRSELLSLTQDIELANAIFSQSAQNRTDALSAETEHNLSGAWGRMVIFGGSCLVLFLWIATLISRGIYWQISELERARAEAEQGRLTTQKLMAEQHAAALELETTNRKLVEASRKAGMAEVATGVIHNVGNVLNSVNTSSSIVTDQIKKSGIGHLSKAVALMRDRGENLGAFLTSDPTGKQLPGFLAQLADHLAEEQTATLKELGQLQKNVEHIKEIVSTQQAYAGSAGLNEIIDVRDLLEDALRIHRAGMMRHDINIVKEMGEIPRFLADKHKVLQILVNLLGNAKHAMKETAEKRLTIKIEKSDGRVRISVADTGYGIRPENMTRIFAHGFTTKADGHGFGLHSGALAAKQMGGSLLAASDGPGLGAVFTLELPVIGAGGKSVGSMVEAA